MVSIAAEKGTRRLVPDSSIMASPPIQPKMSSVSILEERRARNACESDGVVRSKEDFELSVNSDGLGNDARLILRWLERESIEVKESLASISEQLEEMMASWQDAQRDLLFHSKSGSDENTQLDKFSGLSHMASPSQPFAPRSENAPTVLLPAGSHRLASLPSLHEAHTGEMSSHSGLSKYADNSVPRMQSRALSGVFTSEARRQASIAGMYQSGQSSTNSHTYNGSFEASKALDKIKRNRRNRIATKIWHFLEGPNPGTWSYWYFHIMTIITLASVLSTILFSIKRGPEMDLGHFPMVLELTYDCIFSLETLTRFTVCPTYNGFFIDPHNWVDIVASFFPLCLRVLAEILYPGHSDCQSDDNFFCVMLFSFAPVFRLLKLLRGFEKFHLLLRAFGVAYAALPVLLYVQAIIILLFGSLIYLVEPRKNIPTLAKGFWFAIVTMFTVGYGETVPETSIGKVIASVLIVCGSLYMAIPLGIVGNAFREVWDDRDKLLVMKRMRDRLTQSGYKATDIPALFALFDLNRTGELTIYEFSKMIKKMNLVLDNERLLRLFNVLDVDGGGTIDDREFVRTLFPNRYREIYGGAEEEGPNDPAEWKNVYSTELDSPGMYAL